MKVELRKSWKLPRGLHVRLREQLIDAGAEHKAYGKFEQWRLLLGVQSSEATIILYVNGTCTILSGHPLASDVAANLIEGVIYKGTEAELRTDIVADLQTTLPEGPHIGADESGKADYFGPLVCGAVCADHELIQRLIALGVRDCKKLSDRKVSTLAVEIDRMAGQRVAVTILEPEDYNRKYDALKKEGKNLTDLLAWAYARCIEELTQGDFRQRPTSVLIDRFATRLIETLVPATHWGLEVFQVYEAEADAAVAAASIVARAKFLEWMNAASETLGIELPKGTDSKGRVVEVARGIAARDGAETLRSLVKLHHRTTEKVLDRQSSVQVSPVKGELRPACSWRKVRPDIQNLIRERLVSVGAVDKERGEHVAWRLELAYGSSKATVVLYDNGTCERKAGYSPAADLAEKLIGSVIET